MRFAVCWAGLFLSLLALGRERDLRVGVYSGKRFIYEAAGELALYQGDIVIPEGPSKSSPRGAVSTLAGGLWDGGIIPYTIDPGLPDPGRVTAALAEWSGRTPLRFSPYAGERNSVRFVRDPSQSICASAVGMAGGEQRIYLADGCDAGAVLHEIGHAAGLWHEQERRDRDLFVTVVYDSVLRRYEHDFDQHLKDSEDVGPYNFASIMHYRSTEFSGDGTVTVETVPAGIVIGQRAQLSAGDVFAVRRMYGGVPAGTTIAPNPPDLEYQVDGVSYTGVQRFDWAPGSVHTVAAGTQEAGGVRYVFGRWSDGGAASHNITASAENALLTLDFIRQFRVTVRQSGGGSVSVFPASEDGFYAERTNLELRAEPADGFAFLEWKRLLPCGMLPGRVTLRSPLEIEAAFTSAAVTTIASEPPGQTIVADGVQYMAPQRFAWTPGISHTVSVRSAWLEETRYQFREWSDGGGFEHRIIAGADHAVLTARFTTQYKLRTLRTPAYGGSLTASPPAPDGFYDAGSVVELKASPDNSYVFAGFGEDIKGMANPQRLTVVSPSLVVAEFADARQPPPISVANAASLESERVAPGSLVSITGADIGTDTRVLFDGAPAPVVSLSSGRVTAVVPDRLLPGTVTSVQVDSKGKRTPPRGVPLAETAPGLFAGDAHGRGQAYGVTESVGRGGTVSLFANGIPARHAGAVQVRIGGVPAEVLAVTEAAEMPPGTLRIEARVPEAVLPRERVPVLVVCGLGSSQAGVTIPVR